MTMNETTYLACCTALIAQADIKGLIDLLHSQFPAEERFILHGDPPRTQTEQITHGLYADAHFSFSPTVPGLILVGTEQTASRQHLILGPYYDEFMPFDKGLRFIDEGHGRPVIAEIKRLVAVAPQLVGIQPIVLSEKLYPRHKDNIRDGGCFSSHRYEGLALFRR